MSGSPQLNRSTPTALTPFSPNHLVSPVSFDCPQGVFSRRRPGLLFFIVSTAYRDRNRST